ncbi:riboflavin synthase subunit alpha [Candidatus Poseidoniales archaeon]|nr:riboflavin synthase subunit alpha [Candidatus Poseidoniales archaeon]MDB2333982.1 riboflavin synthase subunit alpha [Candidatus Poseidoniales archaeon]MDB2367642.1 riboflavin synthase subunit alpha [Candidatus Poseidoniales archaeon]MDB2671229.1 riboflavin synthase subunit alpha [Candidatus Poseidoniales archaeon]
MFTGIVQGLGAIKSIEEGDGITTFCVKCPDTQDLAIGASVAIDGVCLTATSIEGELVTFDIIPETMERTTLGERVVNDVVNIERSLRYGDEVGGHLLSGHIIGRGLVTYSESVGEGAQLKLKAPPSIQKYIQTKGYIGIDGISLTLGEVNENEFDLHIIPETLRLTTLGSKQAGDAVNIEIDSTTMMIVETVERLLKEN